ncbi:hypothetical protein ABZ318_15675 [Streptomyces sp. NPDC006197]|uniref:hypothetical protein n=1 Tax=Streptomyces sp. NPDC006197 TaxID=3156685 RepID=UPI0033B7BB54
MVLVKNLPADSAVQREIHGEAAEWSLSDHLLAAAVDHLAVANWMFQCVNTGEDDETPDPPKPVPRPGATDEDGEEQGEDGGSAAAEAGGAPSHHALARFFG